MRETVEAIYKDGVLRPLKPLHWLEEDRRVSVTVDSPEPGGPLTGWVGGLSDDDARDLLRVVDSEFERIDSNEW